MRCEALLWVVVGCSGSAFDIAPPDDAGADIVVDTADSGTDTTSGEDTDPSPDGAAETMAGDAKVDAPATCPAPRSTKTHEVTATDCVVLRAQHAKAVAGAKVCNCDEECSDKLDPTLCGCQSYASSAREEYLLALAIADQISLRGCPVPCTATPCKVPIGAKCVAMGAGKVCQDLF